MILKSSNLLLIHIANYRDKINCFPEGLTQSFSVERENVVLVLGDVHKVF